jgi:anti-sigma factor ChrR (cupin superfamily)
MGQTAFIHNPHIFRVQSDALPWLPVGPGAYFKPLWYSEDTGAWSVLSKAEPGVVLPYHLHHAPGEFFVLQGHGSFPDGEYKPGDYFFEPPSVYHDATVFETETVLYYHSYGAVTFYQEDRKTPAFVQDFKLVKQLLEKVK